MSDKKEVVKREELATVQAAQMDEILSNIVLKGDISQLKPSEKVQYYNSICKRIGIDPMLQPFQLLKLQGKEVMYATKGCTEQLRMIHGISVTAMTTHHVGDCYVVQVTVQNAKGRVDFGTGAVAISNNLKGDALANALMKAETKAKRRATLSICGLGMLDETELETIPDAKPITGEIELRGAPMATKVSRVDDMPEPPSESEPTSDSPAPATDQKVALVEWRDEAKRLERVGEFDAAIKKLLAGERVKKLDELALPRQATVVSAMANLVRSWQKQK